jgi:zinc-binding in reverse transcriptase
VSALYSAPLSCCVTLYFTYLLTHMQDIIHSFVKGNFKVSKKLIDSSVIKGGLGMINISDFITAQQCSWVKKAYNSNIDGWRTDLNSLCNNSSVFSDTFDVNEQMHPIIYNICSSFSKFKSAYYHFGSNFLLSPLAGNPLLINNKREKIRVRIKDFTPLSIENSELYVVNIGTLLNENGNVKSLDSINEINGLHFTPDDFIPFRTCIKDSCDTVRKNMVSQENSGTLTTDLRNFITRFKKGSRPFRKYISSFKDAKIKSRNNTTVKTFFRLINLHIPVEREVEKLNILWNNTCYPNKLREFAWKFRTNILGINTRVSHFNANISRGCTFCSKNNLAPVPDESFLHLFFDCRTTCSLLNQFGRNIIPELFDPNNADTYKKLLFTGCNPTSGEIDNFFIQTVAILTMFYIWECKLQKKTGTNGITE